MNPKFIAHIIYYIIMGVSGIVMSTASLRTKDWQYWVIVFSLVGAFLCGMVIGG